MRLGKWWVYWHIPPITEPLTIWNAGGSIIIARDAV